MSRAIFYFKNGIGNFVMMMPAIQAMAYMTKEPVDICMDSGWVDHRKAAIEEMAGKWETVGKVIQHPKDALQVNGYDYWFYSLHNGGSEAISIFRQKQAFKPVAVPDWSGSLIHEEDHYMEIARSMGFKGPKPEIEIPIADSPILDLRKPIIGLCNGAFISSDWQKKHWPHFKELADVVRLWTGGSVIGVGGPGELDGVELDDNYCGKTSITETTRIIGQMSLLITTDTGCMHLSDALHVPLIALFGPTLTSKNAPRGPKSRVVMSDLECAPCQYTTRFHNCKGYLCMESIDVGSVMHEVRKILEPEGY